MGVTPSGCAWRITSFLAYRHSTRKQARNVHLFQIVSFIYIRWIIISVLLLQSSALCTWASSIQVIYFDKTCTLCRITMKNVLSIYYQRRLVYGVYKRLDIIGLPTARPSYSYWPTAEQHIISNTSKASSFRVRSSQCYQSSKRGNNLLLLVGRSVFVYTFSAGRFLFTDVDITLC